MFDTDEAASRAFEGHSAVRSGCCGAATSLVQLAPPVRIDVETF